MLDRKIIQDRMSILGLSLAALAAYSGISASRLSPWMNNQKNLAAGDFQKVYDMLVALEKLQDAVGLDIPLDLRQIDKIKVLLERRRTGEALASSIF